jgi:hypothetical protein
MEGVFTTRAKLFGCFQRKEKKLNCHYIQNYDLQKESIQFQNVESSIALVEREIFVLYCKTFVV